MAAMKGSAMTFKEAVPPLANAQSQAPRSTGRTFLRTAVAALGAYALWNAVQTVAFDHTSVGGGCMSERFGLVAPKVLPLDTPSDLCPQAHALYPSEHADLDASLAELYAEEHYQQKAFKALGGAIQIPFVLSCCRLRRDG